MTPAERQAFMARYKREHGIHGAGFSYEAYRASFPPELRQYVPNWGPINGVPIEEVAKMLEEKDAVIDALQRGSKPEMRKIHNEALPILLDLIAGRIALDDQRVRLWHERYMQAPREVVTLARVEYPEDPNVP